MGFGGDIFESMNPSKWFEDATNFKNEILDIPKDVLGTVTDLTKDVVDNTLDIFGLDGSTLFIIAFVAGGIILLK